MRRLRTNIDMELKTHKNYETPITYGCQNCLNVFSTNRPACKVRCPGCGSKYIEVKNLNGNAKL